MGELTPAHKRAYERLKKVRASKTVSLKPCSLLRGTITGFDGKPTPFKLRYYQVQAVYHMLVLKRMLLGEDTGLGKCVTQDTLVITNQGMVPIWQLAPDEELEPDTFYEPRTAINVWAGGRWVKLRRFYWNGYAETRVVTTRNGYRIEGSLQHPILVRDIQTGEEAFVKLPNLDPDRHWVCLSRTLGAFPTREPELPDPGRFAANARRYKWPSRLTPDLARLLGYVVGEAWAGSHHVLNIEQHQEVNPEPHDDIRELLHEVYGWEGNQGSQNRDKNISVNSVWIRDHFLACGVSFELSAKKEVPWTILQGTFESVRQFLRGLFEAEGSVCKDGGVEFSSASEKLARTLHQLLLRCGIVAKLSPKRVNGFDHTYWRVQFFGDDARRFQDLVGFVSTRKKETLRAVLDRPSNPNKDVVPGMADFFEGVRERLGTIRRFGNAVRSTLMHVARGRRNPSYPFLKKLHEILKTEGLRGDAEDVETILTAKWFYEPIATIEEGYAPLMDIEVDHPDHAFVGNGFVNHNTIETIAAICYLWENNETANKVIVVAPKSAMRQWAGELERFTTGVQAIVAGSRNPDPTADCTCLNCGNTWQTKATGKKIVCKKCKTAWAKAQKDDNGAIIAPEPITVERESPVDVRREDYAEWAKPYEQGDPWKVLITNYALLVRDWNHGGFQPPTDSGDPDHNKPVIPGLLDKITASVGKDMVVIYDECTAFKSMRTKTWEYANFLSQRGHRVYGLTATLLKNRLMEGYCIFRVIKPGVFTTKTKFYEDFCYVEMKKIPGRNIRIPIVLGYKNLDRFRECIDPFFLGRKKHMVSAELPTLTTREVIVELSSPEDAKYGEALSGILELGDGDIRDYDENKALVSLTYCQQVVDSLRLLKFEEGDEIESGMAFDPRKMKVGKLGTKEQALVDLITGELDDEKLIVYTRFASLVPRLQAILKREGVKSVAITGKVTGKKRAEAQDAFQDMESDTKVIFITAAGTEALNLQAAIATVFYDLPWSWGDYLQALGRMIRIGSPHQKVLAYHLVAYRPNRGTKESKTIDHHVLGLLRRKRNVIDKVLGEGAVGALKFDRSSSIIDLVRQMQEDARSSGKSV